MARRHLEMPDSIVVTDLSLEIGRNMGGTFYVRPGATLVLRAVGTFGDLQSFAEALQAPRSRVTAQPVLSPALAVSPPEDTLRLRTQALEF